MKSKSKKKNARQPDDHENVKLNTGNSELVEKDLVEKRKIMRNLVAFSFSYLFQFSALNGLYNLQSSLNSHQNLGIVSLMVSSVTFTFSCLFVPVVCGKYVGFKWSLVFSELTLILLIGANYYASFYTIVPTSVLYGVSLSVLWTFQGSFIAHLTNEYALLMRKNKEKVMMKFFAIFMIIFQINQIIGNMISGLIFNKRVFKSGSNFNESLQLNWTMTDHGPNSTAHCGSQDCPGPQSDIERPDDEQILWLCGTYLFLTILAALILVVFMDNIKPSKDDIGSISKSLKDTFFIFLDKKIWILVPIFAFVSASNTFITIDLSKSFVACAYGIHSIGYWFVLWGLSSSVFSLVISQLSKHINKTFIMLISLVLTFLVMIYLLKWNAQTNVTLIYVIALLYGFFEATWGTILNTIIAITFHDQQTAAFSSNRFCISVCFFITFAYSNFLCVYQKIFIVMGLVIVAMLCSLVLEFIVRRELKLNKSVKDQTFNKQITLSLEMI